MRCVAIIQARATGDRLPGKVLLPLANKSMLQNIVERVKRAKKIEDVALTFPDADHFRIWPMQLGVAMLPWRDDQNDLIGRFYDAAKYLNADLIVRICADNPCIEPEAIDLLVEHGIHAGYLTTNAGDYRTAEDDFGWPNGIGAEIYPIEMLDWMNKEIRQKFQREHPHRYFHDMHNVIVPPCPPAWSRPDIRLDVDTQKDYEFVKAIYDHFGNNEFHITDVLRFLDGKKNLEERAISPRD
jgi:spore coat polysaccharide biosynthesis protein SpsF